VIRSATRADLPVLSAIAFQCGLPSFDRKTLAEDLERPNALVLVAETTHVIGFLVLWWGAGESDLLAIAVVPGARRAGVARTLLHEGLEFAKEHGAEAMHLEVRASNMPARTFYSVEGFTEVGVRPRYYSDGEDAVLMRRIIR
jgi:ribosomal-protein-alanine acetyltransferase